MISFIWFKKPSLWIHYKLETLISSFLVTWLVIYLWSKVVCLFCFVLYWWDPPNRDASDRVLGLFGKLWRRRGASASFHGVWTCGTKVLEYWMISTLKMKLNRSSKFWRNWNLPLMLLERSWWAGFNGILFGKIWIQNVGDTDF